MYIVPHVPYICINVHTNTIAEYITLFIVEIARTLPPLHTLIGGLPLSTYAMLHAMLHAIWTSSPLEMHRRLCGHSGGHFFLPLLLVRNSVHF